MSKNYYAEHYLDVSKPGSYSSYEKLASALKESGKRVQKKKMTNWMMGQESYTLHRKAIKSFKRNKVFSQGIDYIWQIDLVDLSKFAKHNKWNKYLLTCIDVFSKFAWVKPLKDKTGRSVASALLEIFSKGRIPKKIHTDEGKEFLNKNVKKILDENDIKLYIVNSELKASVIERFNRTYKERMFRYFTHSNHEKYINVLDDLTESYNNTYHRSIKTRPSNVTLKNEDKIREILYGDERIDYVKFKFKIGDHVRLSKYKTIFMKGYERNWTREVFIVTELLPRDPPVYRVKDFNNELIEGVFYEQELQKISSSQPE